MNDEQRILVVMAGLPGSGKSAFADKLKNRFNDREKCFVIKKDAFLIERLHNYYVPQFAIKLSSRYLPKNSKTLFMRFVYWLVYAMSLIRAYYDLAIPYIIYKLRDASTYNVRNFISNRKRRGTPQDYWKAGYEAFEQAFRMAYYGFSEQANIVILDSAALEPFVLKKANQLISELPDVQLKVILCIADRSTRNKRIGERPPQITRIKVDPVTLDDYLRCFKHLPEDKLVLNTQAPLDVCCNLAMKYLQGVPHTELAKDESEANGLHLAGPGRKLS